MRGSNTAALAAASAGIAFYAVMDAVMKAVSIEIGAYNTLVWRLGVAVLLTGIVYACTRPTLPNRGTMKVHFARSILVAVMALAFFWGIVRVPLAEAIALSFIAPLIALGLAALFLEERITARSLWGSLLGLAGVGVVVAGRIGGTHSHETMLGMAAVLFSAVVYAMNLVVARHQAQLAKPLEIAFFQNLFVLGLLALAAPWWLAVPAAQHWPGIGAAALLAIVSLLGVFGQGQSTTDALIGIVRDLGPQSAVDTLTPVLQGLVENQSAGLTLIIGLLSALWSASGYVGAFARAMNRMYEIDEGRPIWKLRPVMLLVTLVAVILTAVAALILAVSGPVAQAIGDAVGLGDQAVTIWNIAKWPVLLLIVVVVIAILYYATPNVQQPKFRWMSTGAFIAIVVWALASAAFGFYVANFGSYNRTYGSLATVVVFLLWLWITNLALLFGAEIDSELERGRQLQAGIAAEEELQLPARDTRNIEKSREKEQKDIEMGRAIREQADPEGEVAAQYPDATDSPSGRK